MILFNMVSLEIGAQCNRTCWFCPNAYNERPDEFMSMDLINKVVDELASIQYDKRVEFYIYNEPLKDDRLLDIIKIFREELPKACLMIATNGDYVKTAKDLQRLYDAGLNQLQINVYSNVKRYRKLQEMIEETSGVLGNVYSNLKATEQVYSLEEKFDRKLTPTSPKIGRFELSNRSGHVPLPKPINPLKKICVRPFRSMQINWKGEVMLCCNDYNAEVMCGNVNDNTLQEVWADSPVFAEYRTQLLKKDRTGLKLCESCSFKGGEYGHFIPKFWTELV